MSANSDIRIHAANNLNIFQPHKLKRVIIEAVVSYELINQSQN